MPDSFEALIAERQHTILDARGDQLRVNLLALDGGRPYVEERLSRFPSEAEVQWSGKGTFKKKTTWPKADSTAICGRRDRAYLVNYCRLVVWAGDFFCGMKFVVEGRENIPDEPSVIMIKHTSTLETYGHVPVFPPTSWVVKRELLWAPLVGWAIALVFRPIAINRSAGRSAVKQVIDETTAAFLVLAQMDPDIAIKPFELGQGVAQRMLTPFPAPRDVLRAISTQGQNAALGEPAAQVEQQANG